MIKLPIQPATGLRHPRSGLLFLRLCPVLVAAAAAGCGPNQTAKKKFDPAELNQRLREAALTGDLERARAALQRGASAKSADENGRTSLMLAAFNGHTDLVKLLLEKGAEVNARDSVGRTALMYAASGPFPETVRVLLGAGAEVNARDKGEGWTALMFAAAEGHLQVVKLLVEAGAMVDLTDGDGDRAADFAYRNGHREVFEFLKSQARQGR